MARRHGTTMNSRSHDAKAHRRRLVGLSASAGAFLAFGLGPLASAPPVHADVLDVIVDPIAQPLQQALAGVTDAVSAIDPTTGLDALAGVDPAAVLAGVDLGGVGDTSAMGVGVPS